VVVGAMRACPRRGGISNMNPFCFTDSDKHKQLHDLFFSFVDDVNFFEKKWLEISSRFKEWEIQAGKDFSSYIHENSFLAELIKVYPSIFKDVEKNGAVTKIIYPDFYSSIGKETEYRGSKVTIRRAEVSERGCVLYTFKRADGSMFTWEYID
jgi:hypothetical protein